MRSLLLCLPWHDISLLILATESYYRIISCDSYPIANQLATSTCKTRRAWMRSGAPCTRHSPETYRPDKRPIFAQSPGKSDPVRTRSCRLHAPCSPARCVRHTIGHDSPRAALNAEFRSFGEARVTLRVVFGKPNIGGLEESPSLPTCLSHHTIVSCVHAELTNRDECQPNGGLPTTLSSANPTDTGLEKPRETSSLLVRLEMNGPRWRTPFKQIYGMAA